MELSDKGSMLKVLKEHGFWTKKVLGQNFLISKRSLNKIVAAANIQATDHIIEVGPGLGTLSAELAQKAKQVTSIEIDRSLIPILEKNLANHKNVEIIRMDALKFTPPATPYKLVANIPYNITSPLINHFLQQENRPQSITFLIQKEVAEKIECRDNKHSVLSLQVALFGKAKFIAKVPASHFHPAPKVDSAIIHIEVFQPGDPRHLGLESAQKILRLSHQAFAQRRKKLSNTLPLELLQKAGIDPNRRPETLSREEWISLA